MKFSKLKAGMYISDCARYAIAKTDKPLRDAGVDLPWRMAGPNGALVHCRTLAEAKQAAALDARQPA